MRRREFISLIGGVAVAWPLAARAQQSDRVRVIGSLNILAEDDPEAKLRMAAFKQSLQQLGWTEGSNVRIESAGPVATPAAFTNTRPNCPRSRPMSS
jgi:hypothetical protein